jgi:SAM-dependent methyltransferase
MQKLYRIENPEETYNIHLKKRNLDAGLGHMREIAFIIKYLDQHPSHLHFLDFGMGWGDWCLMAKALGCNAFGCELSQNKIYYANNNGISNIPFTEIGKDRWDFINTEQVMEHTSNPVDLVRHLSDSLKPGGILKISVPDRNYGVKEIDNANMSTNLFKTYKDFYSTSVQPLEHINCFHRPSLVHLGKTAELEYVTTPVLAQYVSSVTGSTIKKLCKNALKPIFRALFKKNYIFLKKAR